jgi:hypothetical protein
MVRAVGVYVTGRETEAEFPATSVPATAMVFAPGVRATLQDRADWASEAGAPLQVAFAIPESDSVTVPVTGRGDAVTVVPEAGEVTVMTGGVLSSLTVTVVLAVLPPLSLTVPETIWPAVSVVTVTGEGQVRGGAPPAQENDTVTFALFQPAALGGGFSELVMVRAVGL